MKKCTSLNKKQRDEISKLLSYLLRHAPESMGLTLDRDGWSDVDDLIRKANAHGHAFDRQALNEVVETNEKKRFTLSEDDQRIRAAQGHSTVQVQVQHAEKEPPATLYHGTASRFMTSIETQGLIAGSRHHVHLTEDPETAMSVGKRYGQPVLLAVDAKGMFEAGVRFFQADNGIWLVKAVSRDSLTVLRLPIPE
ncbi:putative RNA 2'-phosphotransferase [Pseudomonas amygdali pv. photiniae]|uniref:Probable RNA 2'-phosphotransferase n=5 Tax=Pseudomonas syringae group TaxID=136849 RepID=A0A3M5G8F5_PSESS|nr:RNA 2'-phosphotransferase [Pseudomonas amygdali pv. aesculi str. 0893_23]KPW99380.1 putative RNA 2'-phosphotransferase [Pseudomonas syringae pv. castaneae]KPX23936.1 putative RNA 2'-phosphotransferase [Pseudomonas amygdali pv. dendropanacis]KPX79699.1 putative RNA 2'-phosphotransferase [Pseudomonas amygdali pv. photiniae]KPZ17621.1 putative RNA 2'-phosphotransferase [Pseudomonas amygdali pv. ulmi]KWS90996.1 RNA 2'-phosphotransferase [Pseudomonas syringae pv. cerasicola]KWS95333.1 RNA 2'-ph